MVAKAEEKAEVPASDGRTDKEKMADIGLSPEEQAALEGKDTDEAGKDADADAGKEADDAKGKDATDDKTAADQEADAAAAGEPGPAETVPDHFTPLAETLTPEDLKLIDSDLVALKAKFDDGDIDYEQYTDERLEIEKVIWHHEQAEMNNANAVEQRWQWERDWYLQSNSELNQSQVVYGAFASQVNALLADDEWNTAPGFDLLSEAHRRVSSEIDSLAGPGSGAPNGRPAGGDKEDADRKAADALKKAKAAESGKRPPDTLAGKPAAAANTDESKFAYLDGLDGEKLQAAVDKLSPADLKEYEDHH